MNAGRSKHHLANNVENPKNTFLMVGYCSPETPGGILRSGARSIKLYGEVKMVNARVELMDSFSAHGDRVEMLDFMSNQKESLKGLFLVHGEYDTQQAFSNYLSAHGMNANIEIPDEGEIIVLG